MARSCSLIPVAAAAGAAGLLSTFRSNTVAVAGGSSSPLPPVVSPSANILSNAASMESFKDVISMVSFV